MNWAPVVTKRRHILVVEDDSEICALLSDLLTEMGHEVTCAASDKEAYGAFQRETIEALVVDINLGRGTTGFDVARLARSFNPDLPVAYVTGGSPQSVARFGVEGGVLVSKPFDRELFIETMQRMLSE
jgi:CheY-like chemotaxis protein